MIGSISKSAWTDRCLVPNIRFKVVNVNKNTDKPTNAEDKKCPIILLRTNLFPKSIAISSIT